MEFRAVWNTFVSSPPKPAFPKCSKLTALGGGAGVIETVVELDWVGSASLVAVTVSVPALAGAVYKPDGVIVPRVAFQVTDLSAAVPCTLAAN